MRIHSEWNTAGFELDPVARFIGPFASRPLLQIWWEHRGAKRGRLLIVESDDALLPLYLGEEGVRFVGEEHVVDYHSPLGDGVASLVASFADALPSGTPFRLDSLPAEACDVLLTGLAKAGIDVAPRQHEVAAVLQLPETIDDYLGSLSKKQRHEIRRKRRRFEEQLGPARLIRREGRVAIEMFAEMHRRSPGAKGSFMTHVMAAVFAALHRDGDAHLDVLYGDADHPVAAAFGFEDDDGYYLYNSAYDPDAAAASPGIVLLGMAIEQSIDKRLTRFDFLKGGEEYKFRLGAEARPLFVLEGATPG